MPKSLREQAASLPVSPGVYLFKNAAGEILYVGKAVRLRERVRSYFAPDLGDTRGPGFIQMVRDSVTLDHEATGSEMEALLLEARLIRQHKPRYNIKLRDDKSFALIRIDLSEEFPPIYISREKELEEMLAVKRRDRAHVGKVSQRIDNQEFFGPYLSAASVRQALKTMRKIWPFRDCTDTKFKTYQKLGHGCIFATLHLCDAPCVAKITAEEYRKNIDQVRQFLRGDRQQVVRMIQEQMETAAKEERYEEAAKCRDRLQSLLHLREVAQTRRSIDRQRSDRYAYDPEEDIRIEAYDISNIQGAYAVGSQIVGIIRRGKIDPVTTRDEARKRFYLDRSRYRKFRIKTVEGVSDTDMLKEVLTRRLRRGKTADEHWSLPDLIMIDGGKGQLNAALEIRKNLDMVDMVPMASVAKGPTRKRVDLYGTEWDRIPCVEREGWLMVAELLREEAHRFAITYYRRVHRKSLTGK